MAEFLPTVGMPFEHGLCESCNFRCDRVRPRIAKSKFGRSFFSGDFRWGFNGGAKWITHHACILTVSVVDAPQLLVRCQNCAHAGSSSQTMVAKLYLLHKVRGLSSWIPSSFQIVSIKWLRSGHRCAGGGRRRREVGGATEPQHNAARR